MRDFSQLLDALVYTRSRTAKLKLIGDYLKRTPDPDRGYALAALTGELNLPGGEARGDPRHRRGTGRSGAAPYEPRLCRRHGRDGVAALARAGGRSRRTSTTAPCASPPWSSGSPRSAGPRRRARSPRCSTISTSSGRFALLKLATGRAAHRHLRAARQGRAGRGLRARRRCGRGGLARHRPALSRRSSTGPRARAPQPTARGRAGLPPLHARPSARGD